MFGLTKREQRWKAEQKAAETIIPMITAIAVEAMKQDDKDAEMAQLRQYLDAAQRRGEELRAEVAGLRKALAAAIRQNEHDMLMTGEELRAARAALGDKTPTTPLPSPSPRS